MKPLYHSRRWIPIASMDAKVNLYLDFDPPAGGTPGQVIRTALGEWQVLAPSFLAFFQQYVHDLEGGRYRVDANGWVERDEDDSPQPSRQLPPYLQSVVFECPTTTPTVAPDMASLLPGQTVTLEGTIEDLQGNGTEKLFILETPWGSAYSIFASAQCTVGFLQIRCLQHARVVVTRPDGTIESRLRPDPSFVPIELVALRYTMLRAA